MDYAIVGPNVGGTVTWIINPTLVNEFTFGWADWREKLVVPTSTMNNLLRANVGFSDGMNNSVGQLPSATNLLGLIPGVKVRRGQTAHNCLQYYFPPDKNAYS